MALIVMPSLLSKRPWARIRARCEASFFIVFSKSVRCCSVRGSTYLTLIDLESGCTYHIVWELQREILYQKTFGLALNACRNRHCPKCQTFTKVQWVEDRKAELLPVPYYFQTVVMETRETIPIIFWAVTSCGLSIPAAFLLTAN